MNRSMKASFSRTRSVFVVGAVLGLAHSANALTFNLVDGAGLSSLQGSDPAKYAQVRGGFDSAASLWSNLFADPVTINIQIDFAALASGVLGSTGSTQNNFTYTQVRNALVLDLTSADDLIATTNLPAAPAVNMLLNRTSNSPNGSGNATPFLDSDGDANNTILRLTRANAKSIGLVGANDATSDASITFSSGFSFDFDRSNGINGGEFDFVGVAAHEIGHALGFVSGVDILDNNSPPVNGPFSDDQFTFVSPLDLYRFSAASFAFGAGTIDWTANNTTKYFSIDGGATSIVTFSTGINFGDGRQASHWKDNLGVGLMDPTAAPGELVSISQNDIRGFDVIGWTRFSGAAAAPEPATLALLGVFAPIALILRRKR